MSYRATRWLPATLLMALAPIVPIQAQESSTDEWRFEATPYIFGAGLDGTSGIGGVEADIDMSFEDLLDYIDSAFMGVFEARKGIWGFGIDTIYTKLKDEKSRSWTGPGGIGDINGEIELTMTQQIYQLTVAYRLQDAGTKFDLIGAGRYTQLDTEVDLSLSGTMFPGGSVSADDTESWWDPVIGVRVIAPFAEKWSFLGYADVGGFGVGSDSTYQAIAGVNWHFAESFTAKGGFRYLYQDYENDDDEFVWDMALQGAYLGLGIIF